MMLFNYSCPNPRFKKDFNYMWTQTKINGSKYIKPDKLSKQTLSEK